MTKRNSNDTILDLLDVDMINENYELFDVLLDIMSNKINDLSIFKTMFDTLIDFSRDDVNQLVIELRALCDKYDSCYSNITHFTEEYSIFIADIEENHSVIDNHDIIRCNGIIKENNNIMRSLISNKNDLRHEKDLLFSKANLCIKNSRKRCLV